MEMRLNEQEMKCVELIAKWFEENQYFVSRKEAIKEMGVDDNTYDVLMKRMEHIGAIENVTNVLDAHGHAFSFRPSANSVELMREIDAQKKTMKAPVDIVEQLKKQIRQNPWTAWPIIIILGLAFLVPAINQSWELIMKIVRAFFQK